MTCCSVAKNNTIAKVLQSMLNYMEPAFYLEFRWREVDKKNCTNQFRNEMKWNEIYFNASKFKRDIPIQFSACSFSPCVPNRKKLATTHMLNTLISNTCVQGSSTRTKRNECRATCIERKAEENSEKERTAGPIAWFEKILHQTRIWRKKKF